MNGNAKHCSFHTGIGCQFIRIMLYELSPVQLGLNDSEFVADAFPRSRARVLSSANSAGALAWTVGPPLGGILFANFGFRAPFVCSGIPPPLLLLLIRAVAPRNEEAGPGSPMKAKPPTRAELTSWLCAVSSLGLYMPAIASTVTSMKWTIFDIGVAVWLMDEFGYTVQQAAFAFSCFSLSSSSCIATKSLS